MSAYLTGDTTSRDIMSGASLARLAAGGQRLACVNDVEYREVAVVFVLPPGGTPSVYCQRSDWAATPAAQLAAKDQRIAELAARCLALEAQLAEKACESPAQNQVSMLRAQTAQPNDTSARPPADPVSCPDCGKADLKNARALQMHRQRAHQGMSARGAPLGELADDQGWRCAERGCSGAFARDLHDRGHCTQHAVRSTNGIYSMGEGASV